MLLNNIGGVYQARRDLAQALTCYEQALALDRAMNHQAGIAREVMNIGALYVERHNSAKAEPLLAQAVELLQSLGSPQAEQAEAWLARARDGLVGMDSYLLNLLTDTPSI